MSKAPRFGDGLKQWCIREALNPIYHKSGLPYPKGPCQKTTNDPGCHNYDVDGRLGYTCLIKCTTPQDPGRVRPCEYRITRGQSVLVF